MAMVRKAGMASRKSPKSMRVTGSIMKTPTMTSTGAVATAGTQATNGVKNRASRNRLPTVTAVSPVRPPSATPAALSTYVVVVLVPRAAPATVASESASSAPRTLGRLPVSSSMSALPATPTSVPAVSKRSTKVKVSTTVTRP